MRPATDDRNDGPAKIDLLKKIGLSKIAFALEDKIEVARVFRRHGVLTLMVGSMKTRFFISNNCSNKS